MIKLTNINKIYGTGDNQVHALKDVNLELPDGKFIAIVGKSGSGKSTLMNIIGALDSPTSGTVNSNGFELTKLNSNKLADYRNKNIGYIFQSFYLEPTFTVLENVAMPLTIAGMKRSEREALAKASIEKLGLTEKLYKKANELSGGQKQRVSIARALVHNPDLLLADEPTGNLDSQNGAEVIKLLQDICDSGKTVVLVTHNIEDAKKTDLMVEIKDGVVSKLISNSAVDKQQAQVRNDYDEEGNLISKNGKRVELEKPVEHIAPEEDEVEESPKTTKASKAVDIAVEPVKTTSRHKTKSEDEDDDEPKRPTRRLISK